MAANVPAKLKPAGITPYVLRANQLRQAKPVIAYWCDYWVVNQILAKQLHNADEECLQFTTTMMDQLEQTKVEHAGNEAILNDAEGEAAVELFAQETFERALRPLKANKVTQQTAVTFEAAATFLQLVNIWHPPTAETEKKIKFSKWNAARILRAIKEGKDPNESNPNLEEEENMVAEDDPELQAIMSGQAPRSATVEDAPDEESSRPNVTTGSSSYAPAPVSAPNSPPHGSAPAPEQVSPIAPGDHATADSYFPSAPSALAADQDPPLELPSAPTTVGDPELRAPSPTVQPPPALSPPTLPDTPNNFYRPAPISPPAPPATQSQPQAPSSTFTPQPPVVPSNNYYQQPQNPVVPTFSPPAPSAPAPAPVSQPASAYSGAPPSNSAYIADDMAMAQAQKHAKWAISALNFEDVPTAVRELKAALAVLGAQ